jgi:exonuclease III
MAVNMDFLLDDWNINEVRDTLTCEEWLMSAVKKEEDLCIVHLNLRTIKKYWDQLCVLLDKVLDRIDVIVLSETRMNKTIETYVLDHFNSVHFIRHDCQGGGLSVFVHEKFSLRDNRISPVSFEGISVDISNSEGRQVTILAMYRPPYGKVVDFIDELDTLLKERRKNANIVIVGDMNINILQECNMTNNYMDMLLCHRIKHCINKCTREEPIGDHFSETCIDHIAVGGNFVSVLPAIIKCKISDHYMTGVLISAHKNDKDGNNERNEELKMKNVLVKKRLKENLCEVNQNLTECPRHNYLQLREAFASATFMFKNRERKTNDYLRKPWITDAITRLMFERDKAFKKWKAASKRNSLNKLELRQIYKNLRNKIIYEINQSKERYMEEQFEKCKNDVKGTWKLVNSVLNNKTSESIDNFVCKNFSSHLDMQTVANNFVNTFKDQVECIMHDCETLLLEDVGNAMPNSLFLPEADSDDVVKIIHTLKEKSPGDDGIKVSHLIENTELVVPILKNVINNSIKKGFFCDEIKCAKIRPIYKAGCPQQYSNYRPVSILSTISKAIELYIYTHLSSYLKRYKIIDENQYAYQKGKSTVELLQNLMDVMNEALDKGMHVVVTFVDLSKAFDSISHKKLLKCVKNIGVRGEVFELLKDYLKNRKCKVNVAGVESHDVNLEYGVPQGSFLGPLLYLIYINDVKRCFKRCKYFVYADDTVIISIHKDQKVAEARMQEEFTVFQKWCHDKNLIINGTKTKVMHITTPHTPRKYVDLSFHSIDCIHNDISNCVCTTKIEMVDSFKYLGLMIDKNLNWKCQIKTLQGKLRCCLFKLSLLRDRAPPRIVKMAYTALFESVMSYGLEVWGSASSTNLLTIKNLQKRALKLISKEREDACFGIMSLESLYKFKTLKRNYFRLDCRIKIDHEHHTRHGAYVYQRTANKYGDRVTSVVVPKILNNIPENLRDLTSQASVKKELKRYFVNLL